MKRLHRKLNTRTTPLIQTKGKHGNCKRNIKTYFGLAVKQITDSDSI